MQEKTTEAGSWFYAMKTVIAVAAVAGCCAVLAGCNKSPAQSAPQPKPATQKVDNSPAGQLRAIGDRAVAAVIAKDPKALGEYDHNPEDQMSLSDNKSELYCYLFDSSCIPGGNRRAIYDLFSSVPRLGIDASVANLQGKNYGLLMFYDKSQVSEAELYLPEFQCSDRALKGTVLWRFVETAGKWDTTTLFEYKTERPCKK